MGRLQQPIRQVLFDSMQSVCMDHTDRAEQCFSVHHRQPRDADNTGYFEARIDKIGVTWLYEFVKPLNAILRPRGNHADQPIIKLPWQFSQQQCRAQFPLCQVCLREAKQDNLPRTSHENTTFRSSVE